MTNKPKSAPHCGFTLIELLVVLAIVALLLSIATPRYFNSVQRSREAVLMDNLKTLRSTLDKFYADTGRYPDSLEQLVSQHYLRAVPVDPITERNDSWLLVPPETDDGRGIYDIHSGAPGSTHDGRPYAGL